MSKALPNQKLLLSISITSSGEMRLVLPPDHPGQEPSHPSSSLLKAVARGRSWYEWILAGEVSSQRALAQKLGLNERYVGRVLACAFLAPDIVNAIIDGRQPSDLTFERLTRGLPIAWAAQRRPLGFPALHPRTIKTLPCSRLVSGIEFPDIAKNFPVRFKAFAAINSAK